VHPDRDNNQCSTLFCQYSWILAFPQIYFLEVPIDVPVETRSADDRKRAFYRGSLAPLGKSKNVLVRLQTAWTRKDHGKEGENSL
jgi:hypothetical protein